MKIHTKSKIKISHTGLTLFAVGLLVCGVFAQKASAVPMDIAGNINFTGQVVFNKGNHIGTATAVTAWSNTYVGTADGDFAGLDGSAATFSAPWSFNSGTVAVPLPGGPRPMLWVVGGFTFDLTTSMVQFQNSSSLGVTGTGTISSTNPNLLPTVGTWNFTSNNPASGGKFSFSAGSSVPNVPDGGSAVALLGIALAGVEILRRSRRTA